MKKEMTSIPSMPNLSSWREV